MIFQFSYGKCEKKSKLAVLETLYDTVHYLNWKSLWDCVELNRTLLQQSLAVGLEKEKIGWTIRLCSTFTFINGDCICKWILNTLFFNNGLRG